VDPGLQLLIAERGNPRQLEFDTSAPLPLDHRREVSAAECHVTEATAPCSFAQSAPH
jgi:hypothetical protein